MKNKKGFTLVEMLIVVVIIWILATALIPRLLWAQSQARDVARMKDLSDINQWIFRFYNDNGYFPHWDCTYDLDWSRRQVPTSWWNNEPLAPDLLNKQDLISGWYMSEVPHDPQKNKKHPMSWIWNYCANWTFMLRTLYNTTWSAWAAVVLAANMENYKNLNFILVPSPTQSASYFDIVNSWEVQRIKDNKCDKVSKWTNLPCETNFLSSWVYLYLWESNSQ